MKKYFLLFILLNTIKGFSQETVINNRLNFSEVISLNGVSKDDIYFRAKNWFTSAFKSSNHVIQLDDKNEGQITGKAVFFYEPSMLQSREQSKGSVNYTISVFIKDGKYKYEITDFIHEPIGNSYGKISMGLITTSEVFPGQPEGSKKFKTRVWQDLKNQATQSAQALIESLKSAMYKQAEVKKNDW